MKYDGEVWMRYRDVRGWEEGWADEESKSGAFNRLEIASTSDQACLPSLLHDTGTSAKDRSSFCPGVLLSGMNTQEWLSNEASMAWEFTNATLASIPSCEGATVGGSSQNPVNSLWELRRI